MTPIADEIFKFTAYPTVWQREQVATALVQKYKFLADLLDCHRGIAAWVVLLGFKMQHMRSDLRQQGNREVTVREHIKHDF